jgi:hypothetical protein
LGMKRVRDGEGGAATLCAAPGIDNCSAPY